MQDCILAGAAQLRQGLHTCKTFGLSQVLWPQFATDQQGVAFIGHRLHTRSKGVLLSQRLNCTTIIREKMSYAGSSAPPIRMQSFNMLTTCTPSCGGVVRYPKLEAQPFRSGRSSGTRISVLTGNKHHPASTDVEQSRSDGETLFHFPFYPKENLAHSQRIGTRNGLGVLLL